MDRRSKVAPKAAGTAKGAGVAGLETNEQAAEYHSAGEHDNEFLFAQSCKGFIWRVQVVRHHGRLICNVRAWRRWDDGELRAAAKYGFVIPVDRLPLLAAALNDWLARNPQPASR